MKLSDIHIRDPFVLPVPSEGRYYLYGTMGQYTWSDTAVGFDCYTSADLQTWEGPFPVFRPPAGFWADRSFWAPEVHAYPGRYYMFASFKAPGVCRGTQILASDSPLGPFQPLSAGPVTPPIGNAWMAPCSSRRMASPGSCSATNGCRSAMAKCAPCPSARTSAPLPVSRFCCSAASQAPWAQELNSKGRKGYVTDGPFLHRLPNGELLMLWSSFMAGDYTIGVARSALGKHLRPLAAGCSAPV